MGIVFTHIEPNDLLLLDKMIAEMRETPRQYRVEFRADRFSG
jgi:L-serine deaminase